MSKPLRVVTNHRYVGLTKVASKAKRQRDYRAAVTCMDHSIKQMLQLLDERNVLDDTIVIFLSDNGGSGGADNFPLRGNKGQTWEGGVRVPCLIRWPNGGVPAGAVNHAFLTSLEILPSLAAATQSRLDPKITLARISHQIVTGTRFVRFFEASQWIWWTAWLYHG